MEEVESRFEEIQTISDMKDCFKYFGQNDFVITDKDIFDLKKGLIINASIQNEYSFTLKYKPNKENKEKLITEWLIDNVFRNDKIMFDSIRDDSNILWDLLEIIASLHNEYYKLATGQYYDYMFHWVNKTTGGSIVDDIFKEFEYESKKNNK